MSKRHMQKHEREFVRMLSDRGITAELVRYERHPVYRLEAGGRLLVYSIPGSPGDHRWLNNALRDVSRKLGVA